MNEFEVVNEWEGMACKNCSRFQKEKKRCDLQTGVIAEWNYCALYIPNEKGVTKEKLLYRWEQHASRWIRRGLI